MVKTIDIGDATAHFFSCEGNDVVAIVDSAENGNELETRLRDFGVRSVVNNP